MKSTKKEIIKNKKHNVKGFFSFCVLAGIFIILVGLIIQSYFFFPGIAISIIGVSWILFHIWKKNKKMDEIKKAS